MPLDDRLQAHLRRQLEIPDEAGARGGRLVEDADRLRMRVDRFVKMQLAGGALDREALELACYAIQLPLRSGRPSPARRAGQMGLRERCEQAVELLMTALGEKVDEGLLDRTAAILRAAANRSPALEEAKLLADAVNLDDFGMTGAILLAMQNGRMNGGLRQYLDGFAKREAYGYWDARLKDGFHYEAVRSLARSRVEAARALAESLKRELMEDGLT